MTDRERYRLASVAWFLPAILLALSTACIGAPPESSLQSQGEKPAAIVMRELFPTDNEVQGWRQAGPLRVFSGEELFDYINGGAEVYLEYSFTDVATIDYVPEGSTDDELVITVDIYTMGDPSGAFGIYSYNRSGGEELGVGQESEAGDYQVLFWKEEYYVSIQSVSADEYSRSGMTELARATDSRIAREGTPPGIMALLPTGGLDLGSRTYVRGPIALAGRFYFAGRALGRIGTKFEATCGRWTLVDEESKHPTAAEGFLARGESTGEIGSAVSRLREYLSEKLGPEVESPDPKCGNIWLYPHGGGKWTLLCSHDVYFALIKEAEDTHRIRELLISLAVQSPESRSRTGEGHDEKTDRTDADRAGRRHTGGCATD